MGIPILSNNNLQNVVQGASSLVDEVTRFGDGVTNFTKNPRAARLLNKVGIKLTAGKPNVNFNTLNADDKDWRVKLISKDERYYKGPLLSPLAPHRGLMFPYTPQLSLTHTANWDATSPTHSNQTIKSYVSSMVDNIIVTGDFTCQNHGEAAYCLAAIHFVRAVTKMNYGQDADAGTPPPLLFLEGMGDHILPSVPVVVMSTFLDMPPDVDYLTVNVGPVDTTQSGFNFGNDAEDTPGGAVFGGSGNISRVPTQFSLNVTLGLAYSRENFSTRFSLQKFINGEMISEGDFGGFV